MYGRLVLLMLSLLLAASLAVAGCSEAASNPSSTPAPSASSQTVTGLPVSPRVGSLAPDFELPGLDSRSVKLSDFRGRPVLLNFWGTWCPACVYEMPFLESAYAKKKADGLVILAVDVGDSKARVEQFIEEKGLTFDVVLDYTQSAVRVYGIQYYPTSFLIDKQGVIQLVKVGPFASETSVLDAVKRIMG